MPQNYVFTDDKTGEKFQWDGKAWVPQQPSALNRFATSFLGLPEGTTPGSFLSRTKQEFTDPKVALADFETAMKGFLTAHPEAAKTGMKTMAEPGTTNKVVGATEYGLSGIPLFGPAITGSMEQARKGDIAGSMGLPAQVLASTLIGSPEARGTAAEIPSKVGGTMKTVAKEVIGQGPSMDRLRAAQDITGLKIKNDYLAPLAKAVHDDAQLPIRHAVEQMDKQMPAGIAEKEPLANLVEQTLGEVAKVQDKVPGAIQRLIKGGEEAQGVKSVRALTQKELEAGKLASRLFKEGMSDREVRSTLANLGFAPKQVDAMLSVAGPSTDTGMWDASTLQQVRSQLGRQIFGRGGESLPGPVRVGSIKIYDQLTDLLNKAAEKANVRPSWEVGNQKWRLYNETFDGKWEGGKFHESPLAKALAGQTADEIVKPLTEGNAQWARDLLGRYSRFNPRIPEVVSHIRRFQALDALERFSKPSKYELAATPVAVIDPTFFARLAATRLLTPPLIRWLATHGINPENVRGYEPVEPGIPK